MSTVAVVASPAFEPVDYDPFAWGELERVVPTTESQREIWLADQLSREASLAFNLSVTLRFQGSLDVEALRRALHVLVERHDALRSNLAPGGMALCVRTMSPLSMEVFDLAGLAITAAERALSERLKHSVETPFNLATDELFRAELLRLGESEHILVLTAHHVICDGWSWWVLVRELGVLYGKERGLSTVELSDPVSFADFALHEASGNASSQHGADAVFWQSRYETSVPVLELPTDRPRPPVRSFASARLDHTVDEDLLARLRRVGSRRGASLFATLLAGFSALLFRLTGQSDIVIGIPAAGQPAAGSDGLVGHCVNTLPLRFDVEASNAFSSVLDLAQTTLLDALEHQQCTFGTLLTLLRLPRDPARMPLVSVLFNLDQALDQQSSAFEGVAMEFDSTPRKFETFELFINAVQVKGQLKFECQYNTDLFDAATIQRWLEAYESLLRGALEEGAALGELPIVDSVARTQLEHLQTKPLQFNFSCRMHEHFELQCDQSPMRPAVMAGSDKASYQELEERSNRIAHVLREHGIRKGALVGLALERNLDMLSALLGILKAGAGYVPLDPSFPAERLSYMAADAGLSMLVTTSDHAARFDLRGRPLLLLDRDGDRIKEASTERLGRDGDAASPEDPAYVIYTSGSTGRPKGVVVPHRAVANFLSSMRTCPGLNERDRLVAITTLSFDIAVLELLLPLSVGAEVVLADRDTASDGQALRALIENTCATFMQGTPSSWRLLIEAGWAGTKEFKALCGGEPLAPDLAASLVARCGSVWNMYGPTETTVWSTCARIEAKDVGASLDIHIGRPIANTSVWILDARGELCLPGVPGEICIGGWGVTTGYLNQPELTDARFIDDSFTDPAMQAAGSGGGKLYRTGDRGRWRPDGSLEHLGRLDNQVKVRGYRIELGEIEANLVALDGVSRAVVVVREDRGLDLRLVAYVVPSPGAELSEPALKSQLQGLLPSYMLPQHIIALDALPLLPNGKVDRNTLPPPTAFMRGNAPKAAPRAEDMDPRVHYLTQVWTELLGHPAGPDDNFFELGGHSMLAVQMASRVERDTGHRIKLIRLGAETLGEVASRLPVSAESHESRVGARIGNGLLRLFGMNKASRDER